MNKFEHNIHKIFGEEGVKWLQSLPLLLQDIATRYGLKELKPFTNLSYNYVCHALSEGQPIILKVGLDIKALEQEAQALKAFSKVGGVQLYEQEKGMLILERALPGNPLKSYSFSNETTEMDIACTVMQHLHQAPIPQENTFPHIKKWLQILDKDWNLPRHYLQKARYLRDKLLKTPMKEVLLHGDLHNDNILKYADGWVVIDPKGVIGYSINETWAFIKNIEQDTKFAAEFFGFRLEDVRDWYFIHALMATCWNLEDNLDPSFFLHLAEKAYLLTSK